MKRSTFLVSMLALALGACGNAPEEEVGKLSFSLTATDSAGATYRLRNATFAISGYPDSFVSSGRFAGGGSGGFPGTVGSGDFGGSASGGSGGAASGAGGWGGAAPAPVSFTISTEEDPAASEITRKVLPGSYTVSLNGPWHLERVTRRGPERVAQVVPLSPTVQHVYVWDGNTSRVNYSFGVDGTLIDFRSGDLSIGIDVLRPGQRAPGTGGIGGSAGTGGWAGSGGAGGFGGTGGSVGLAD